MNLDPTKIPRNTIEQQEIYANDLSKEFGMPVIVVSRPGTYGSSGDHRRRRSKQEFLAINGAIDQIVLTHGISRVVLSGQSGGATAAAAIMTLGRNDVSCAVLTSGAFGLLERADIIRKRNGRPSQPDEDLTGVSHPYDPLDHVNGMVPDVDRAIIVVGNERDRVAPYFLQERYVDAVARAGHRIRLLERPAEPPRYHHLTPDILAAEEVRECNESRG